MRDTGTRLVDEEDGFTLVEVLVAAVVLVVGMLGVFTLVDAANGTTTRSMAREGATTLARDLVERSRQVAFDSHGSAAFGIGVRTSLPDAGSTVAIDASTFQVTRRGNRRYTATITSCKIDDPADGIGPHDATFCDFTEPPPGGGNPGPGAPTGTAVTLKLLGLPIAVPLGGELIDSTVCGLLGANPIGSVAGLDALLGRGGTVNSVLGLVNSGADVALCPATATGEQFALDRTAADFSKVTATVTWLDGTTTRTLRQSTLVANPSGA